MMIAPITGIGAVTLLGTFNASVLRFSNESNSTTSGGFGPNQSRRFRAVLAAFLSAGRTKTAGSNRCCSC